MEYLLHVTAILGAASTASEHTDGEVARSTLAVHQELSKRVDKLPAFAENIAFPAPTEDQVQKAVVVISSNY